MCGFSRGLHGGWWWVAVGRKALPHPAAPPPPTPTPTPTPTHPPKGQAGQSGVATSAAAVDAEAGGVNSPLCRQVARRVAAVVHIHNAPGPGQAAAEGAAVARAAAIVDIGDGKACTGGHGACIVKVLHRGPWGLYCQPAAHNCAQRQWQSLRGGGVSWGLSEVPGGSTEGPSHLSHPGPPRTSSTLQRARPAP